MKSKQLGCVEYAQEESVLHTVGHESMLGSRKANRMMIGWNGEESEGSKHGNNRLVEHKLMYLLSEIEQ